MENPRSKYSLYPFHRWMPSLSVPVTQPSPIMSNIFIAEIQDIPLLLSLKYLFTSDLTDPLKWVARAKECARGLTGLS